MESVEVTVTPEGKLVAHSLNRELELVKGLGPTELLEISLAGCIAILISSFCARHQLECGRLSIRVTMDVAPDANPPRAGKIDVELRVPDVTTEAERLAIERISHHCFIHNTLQHPPEINIRLADNE